MAELWESERHRTARFVEQRRRDAQELHWAVLRRVNAHVVYSEHRQAQLQEDSDNDSVGGDVDAAVDGDEDSQPHESLVLDFLEDVDADDMKTLLVDAATSATSSATMTTISAPTPAVAPAAVATVAMAPLTMPTHLLSTEAFDADAGVSELMDELEIDVRSFASLRRASTDEEEERKTEESTPPRHVLEQRVQTAPKTVPTVKPKLPDTPPNPTQYDPDAVAQEMFKWVDGERHPDVVKRRESLRGEKRKRVRRYGTNTLEEQVSVRRVAKFYAAEGDSSSSSGSSSAEDSDFSPVEVIEVDEEELLDKAQDEEPFSESELEIGDGDDEDDDDADAKRKKKAKARRRLRQQQAAEKKTKKKPRTKMVKRKSPAVATAVKKTVKVTTPPRAVGQVAAIAKQPDSEEEEEEEEEIRRPRPRVHAKPAPTPAPVPVPAPVKETTPVPAKAAEAIDLRSESENESMSERDVAVDLAVEADNDSESDEDQPAVAAAPQVETASTKSMVLKLKVSPKDLLELTQKELLAKMVATVPAPKAKAAQDDQVVEHVAAEPIVSAVSMTMPVDEEDLDEGYGTDEIIDEGEEEEIPVETTAAPAAPIVPVSIAEPATEPAAAQDEDDAKSDTGTVDFEQEELEVDVPEPVVAPDSEQSEQIDAATITPKGDGSIRVTPAAENKLQPVSPQVKRSPPSKTRVLADEDQPLVMELTEQADDGDVSEADTVNFEDVDSDIDFGSGESEDFGDDGAVVNSSKGVEEEEEDDEAEFGQFFGAPLKKKKKLATVPAKPQPVAVAKPRETPKVQDASPVKLVRVADTNTPSPEPMAKALLGADARGSNGLRKVQNINTKTVSKGKYQYKRRAIQMVDHTGTVVPGPQSDGESVHGPKQSLIVRSRLPHGELSPKGIRPLQLRLEGENSRYMKYASEATPARPTAKELFTSAAQKARERFDKTPPQVRKEISNGISFEVPLGTGAGLLKPLSDEAKQAKSGSHVPPREPQLDVYQATGAVSQIDDSYMEGYDKDEHKRPLVYQKEIAEAKRNGINVKKGLPIELDPNARIPKKSQLQLNHERHPEHHAPFTPKPAPVRDDREKDAPKSKRARTSSDPGIDNGRPSKYGPSSGSSHAPSASKKSDKRKDHSHSSSSSHHSNGSKNSGSGSGSKGRDSNGGSSHSKKRARTESPRRSREREGDRKRERGHDKERERGRDGGRERDRERGQERDRHRRSRSRSPNSSRHPHRPRSLSPRGQVSRGPMERMREREADMSRSRDSHAESKSPPRSRSAGETSSRRYDEKPAKSQDEDHRSHSYDEKRRRVENLPSYKMSEELARSMSDPVKTSSPLKAQPRKDEPAATKKPEDADVLNSEIDDSDDAIPMNDTSFDGDGFAFADDDAPPVFDIRVPLDNIEIDEELCRRTIYCSNLVHMCDEESLETLFSQYGIAEDRATGFPAVEVFLCQRTNRPRGDARITFVSAEQADLAVSEANFATFGNAVLKVRAMDPRTMRILKAQFDMHRDTWTCPSESCRADVSVWTTTCPKCFCKRQFASSKVNIDPNGWLCSICYMPNLNHTDKCSSCKCTLPPYQAIPITRPSRSRDRSRSRSRSRDRDRGRDRRSY